MMKHKQTADIPVAPEVPSFEANYNLGTLTGSARQAAWARNIRYTMLAAIFAELLDATATMTRFDRAHLFDTLDQWRAFAKASDWIDRRDDREQAMTALIRAADATNIDRWLD